MSDDATIEIVTRATGVGNNVSLKKGWNWISYRPFETLDVNTALINLTATEGTTIKGQDGFAVYDGNQWIGTLTEMHPGMGYQLYSPYSTAFTYPVTTLANSILVETNFDEATNAPVGSDIATMMPDVTNRREYANNMCVVANVKKNNTVVNSENYVIGSFVDDECRGISSLVDNKYFITVYGNGTELVNYNVFDCTRGEYVNTQCVNIFNEKATVNLNMPTEVLVDHSSIYDINLDGYVDISDLVKLVNIILSTDVPPTSADINLDGYVDISDVVFLVNWILEH